MIINNANLRTLHTGFSAAFALGFAGATPAWNQIATEVPSTGEDEEYGWLGQIPGMREWIGERHVHGLAAHGYTLKNKPFELTIGVPRNKIEDDKYGVYRPAFQEMGRASAAAPDELLFGNVLRNGFSNKCYDGQFFFDTDHPVLDASGNPTTVSNSGGGNGTPWFVMDTTRALKPIIYQLRKPPQMVVRNRVEDDNVFWDQEVIWGVDGRWNGGYGFWQMAFGSRQTLDEAALSTAIAAIGSFKGDYGRPLGLSPNLLVVPPALEIPARKLVVAATSANGAENVLAGRLQLLVSPWLA